MAASAGAIRAGKAFVELGADDAKLKRGLKSAAADLKAWGASIAGLGAKITAMGLGIVGPLLGASKVFAEVGSELIDASAETGATVEALSELKFAAEMTGATFEDVVTGLRFMHKGLVAATRAARDGKGPMGALAEGIDELDPTKAADALASIGLTLEGLKALAPEQQFQQVLEGIAGLEDPSMRAATAMSLLGRSGTKLIPMARELGSLMATARRLGVVMSRSDAEAADELGDAFDQLLLQIKFVTVAVGSALAPLLVDLVGWVQPVIKGVIDWVQANKPLVKQIFLIGVAVAAAGAALVAVGATITFVGIAIEQGIFLLGALTSALVTVAVKGFGFLVFYVRSTFSVWNALYQTLKFTLGSKLLAMVKPIGTAFVSAFGAGHQALDAMIDALGAGDFAGALELAAAGMKGIWAELVAGLELSWLELSTSLMAIWDEWKVVIIGVAAVVGIAFTGPLGIVVALFAGSAAVIYQNWETLVENLSLLWAEMGDAVVAVFSPITALWRAVTSFLSKSFDAVLSNWREGGGGLKGWWTNLVAGMRLVWVGLTTGVELVWINLVANVQTAWGGFVNFMKSSFASATISVLRRYGEIADAIARNSGGRITFDKQGHDAAIAQMEELKAASKRTLADVMVEAKNAGVSQETIDKVDELQRKITSANKRVQEARGGFGTGVVLQSEIDRELRTLAALKREADKVMARHGSALKIDDAVNARDNQRNQIIGDRDRQLELDANERFITGVLREQRRGQEAGGIANELDAARKALQDVIGKRGQPGGFDAAAAINAATAGLKFPGAGGGGGAGIPAGKSTGTFAAEALRGLGQSDPQLEQAKLQTKHQKQMTNLLGQILAAGEGIPVV